MAGESADRQLLHAAKERAATVTESAPSYVLRPIILRDARRFIGEHHRHNLPPKGWKFGVGLWEGHTLIGVGVAGQPVARLMDDGVTLEVTRVCTTGEKNANSMIYGALARAAKALGYHRIITYTLAEESGVSLRAAGWTVDAEVAGQASWSRKDRVRVDFDLFGNERRPVGDKVRWIRKLVA